MTALDFEIEDSIECLVFKITRPARLNSITGSVLDGLEQCIDSLEQDTRNRGLIITGDGKKAFCAGTDLFERDSMSEDDRAKKADRARALIVRLHRASFISIAALNGLAYGGGLELAMACTFRIALPEVNCSLPEVKIGLIPAYAGTQLLPSIVGPSRALDMMITGRPINSEEALQFGLINRITIPEIALLDQARHYLSSITKHSKVAINAIQACVEVATPQLTEAGLQIEKNYVVAVGKSEDAKEGVLAFREKRAAVFKHR